MSKYTAEQVYRAAEKMEREGYGGDMLREYAAHLAQPEWPSEEDAKKAARFYAKECGLPLDGVLGPMRAALQSVRPPVLRPPEFDATSDPHKPEFIMGTAPTKE